MKFQNFGSFFKTVGSGMQKHAPEICVGLGIAAGIAAVVTAIKATPKAQKLIEEKKAELKVEKLPVKETVKTVWKCYAPTAACGLASAALIISGTKVSIANTAAMGALYNVSRDAFQDYKESVKETEDEETVKKIEEKAAQKTVDRMPEGSVTKQVYIRDRGIETFIDSMTGQQCDTTVDAVQKAVNDFNRDLRDVPGSLNDWLCAAGFEECRAGGDLFWDIDRTGYLDISLDSTIKDNVPCFVIVYNTPPRYVEDC